MVGWLVQGRRPAANLSFVHMLRARARIPECAWEDVVVRTMVVQIIVRTTFYKDFVVRTTLSWAQNIVVGSHNVL